MISGERIFSGESSGKSRKAAIQIKTLKLVPDLENLQANDEILFGVFPDALNQLLRLIHGLVGVVIERAVVQQLAHGSLALIQTRENTVEVGDGIVQLFSKFGIFGEFAERAVAGIDICKQLVRIRYGAVQVFVEGVVFQEFSCGSIALFEAGCDLVQPVDQANWRGRRGYRQ